MDAAHDYEGHRISGYDIQIKLGAGGMGVVYRAVDTRLGRPVALKFLRDRTTADGTARERLLQEAKAASALDHPNIGTIHGIEETPNGDLFIVMAYYEGETLASRIARAPLGRAEAIGIAVQMGEALAAAHAKGIVHRDIKPSNVILTRDGTAKIVDFGLAKFAGSEALTETGSAVGTAAYMSPEQAQGEVADARSDIWSWGVVLYEMLTGRPPFEAPTIPSLLYQVVHAEPREMATGVPALEAITRRAMAKDPAQRYTAMRAVAELRMLGSGERLPTSTMRIAATAAPLGTAPKRRRGLMAAGAAAIVMAGLLAMPAVREAAARVWDRWHARHIAVLPFRNIANDAAGGALCDGLMEVLTSQLTAMEQGHGSFWVVPSEDVRRRNPKDAAEARRVLGVNRVVTGSVQRQGDAVTLTINLIDAGSGRQIGSAILGDPGGNLFLLQDAATAKLAKLLDAERSAGGKAVDAAAYAAYLQGLGYLQRYDKAGNLDAAIRLLEQASAADATFAPAAAALGEAYWRRYLLTLDAQWIQRANDACLRALAADGQLAAAHITRGRVREGTGQRDLAAEEYRRALELDPRSAEAMMGLARTNEALGRASDAETYFQKAIALRPEYWGTRNALANFYLRQTRYREAETQLEKILEAVPDNAAVYINLGAARFKLDDFAGARAAYQKSIEVSPSYIAYSNLGNVANAEGRFAEGAAAYEKALALNDKDYRVWGSLGHAYWWAGNRDKAQAAYQRAAQTAEAQVKIQPGDARAVSLLAFYDARLERREAALEQIRLALALAPGSTDVELQAAEVYESLGMRQEALEWALRYLTEGNDPARVKRSPELRSLVDEPRVRQQLDRKTARGSGR